MNHLNMPLRRGSSPFGDMACKCPSSLRSARGVDLPVKDGLVDGEGHWFGGVLADAERPRVDPAVPRTEVRRIEREAAGGAGRRARDRRAELVGEVDRDAMR